MSDELHTPSKTKVRSTESNPLLRMYVAARERSDWPPSRVERERVSRAVERIAQELRRRKVRP